MSGRADIRLLLLNRTLGETVKAVFILIVVPFRQSAACWSSRCLWLPNILRKGSCS